MTKRIAIWALCALIVSALIGCDDEFAGNQKPQEGPQEPQEPTQPQEPQEPTQPQGPGRGGLIGGGGRSPTPSPTPTPTPTPTPEPVPISTTNPVHTDAPAADRCAYYKGLFEITTGVPVENPDSVSQTGLRGQRVNLGDNSMWFTTTTGAKTLVSMRCGYNSSPRKYYSRYYLYLHNAAVHWNEGDSTAYFHQTYSTRTVDKDNMPIGDSTYSTYAWPMRRVSSDTEPKPSDPTEPVGPEPPSEPGPEPEPEPEPPQPGGYTPSIWRR